MKVTIAHDEGGDWEAIYVDGVCKTQNHSHYTGHVLEALGIAFESIEVPSAYGEAEGSFPDDLEDLTTAIEEYK